LANPPTSTPHHRGIPLPPPVSPLIYPLFGVLNRGVNAERKIFLEIFWVGGKGGQKVKKNFPKKIENLTFLGYISLWEMLNGPELIKMSY
jgi:hypothetical protein